MKNNYGIKSAGAVIDAIYNNQGYGDVASRLLNNNYDVNSLRTNAVLRKEEWIHVDRAVVKTAAERMVLLKDMEAHNLVYNVPGGLASTVLQFEKMSDMSDAEISMDGANRSKGDRVDFSIGSLPLFIIHKGFTINGRLLAASRNNPNGSQLDTTQSEVAARKVIEKAEEVALIGNGGYKFGEGTAYGLVDFPDATSVNVTPWDDSAATGPSILADVLALKQASRNNGFHGPWGLYIPSNWESALDSDYDTTARNKTVRQRLLEIEGISFIRVADKMTVDTCVLVQLTSDVFRIVKGLKVTPVEWTTEGGTIHNFKVMGIYVPQPRSDYNNACGIIIGVGV